MIEASLRKSGALNIAGVDEAGRGACAGPLVVAALIFKDPESHDLANITDSKDLTPLQREKLFDVILEHALTHSIIVISSDEIDEGGVHRANLEGMRRAVLGLEIAPDYVLTDGYEISGLNAPALAVWKGDQVALTISAASILAKVTRDRIMIELHKDFPHYGFDSHKGYITSAHTQALKKHGPAIVHRKSFANISSLLHK
jgi:ribonuclease HII